MIAHTRRERCALDLTDPKQSFPTRVEIVGNTMAPTTTRVYDTGILSSATSLLVAQLSPPVIYMKHTSNEKSVGLQEVT